MVEHYFWRPQSIGRKTDPTKDSQPWSVWRTKLGEQESPLNHILDLVFHLAPQPLLDELVSEMVGRPLQGMQLVQLSPGMMPDGISYPDIVFRNADALVFVEMKVDSRSSIDQFVKYAIVAQFVTAAEAEFRSVDLIILSRYTEHARIWKRSGSLGLSTEAGLREVALQGLAEDAPFVFEAGIRKFLRTYPNAVSALQTQIQSMGLRLVDYELLAGVLRSFVATDNTAARLVHGVISELKRRGLVK